MSVLTTKQMAQGQNGLGRDWGVGQKIRWGDRSASCAYAAGVKGMKY